MFEIGAPWWLLGAAALPLIWWLYRRAASAAPTPVSALFLWPASEAEAAHAAQTRTDPWWLLQAALWLCLLGALSEPLLRGAGTVPVTLWWDDSLSMQTREAEGLRRDIAIHRVRKALAGEASAVRVRALSDHQKLRDLDGLDKLTDTISAWQSAGPPKLPSALEPGRNHWLVTDAAADTVSSELARAAFHRVILVGERRDNGAVVHLSARPSLRDRDAPRSGLVRVLSSGQRDSTRQLRVTADDRVLLDTRLNLRPDQPADMAFHVPAGVSRLAASLEPPDALAEDDALQLDLAALKPQTVRLEPACGIHLSAALAANPGIALLTGAADSPARLLFDCPQANAGYPTRQNTTGAQARVIWYRGGTQPAPDNPLRWHGDFATTLNRVFLDAGLMRPVKLAQAPAGRPVLTAGPAAQPLITRTGSTVEVRLDPDFEPLVRSPAYPVLVNGIVEIALQSRVLTAYANSSRASAESRIAPGTARPQQPPARPPDARIGQSLEDFLIAGALLLLLLDSARRWRRGRRRR